MLDFDGDLKKHLNDEHQFNNISSEIFSKTEAYNLNKIVKKTTKEIGEIDKCKRLLLKLVVHQELTQRKKKQSSLDPKTSAGHETEIIKNPTK